MKPLMEQLNSQWTVEQDMQEAGASLPKGVIMQARGKFAHAGKITSNGRLYTRKWYEKEIKRQKVENEQLISDNVLASAEISKQRELNVELEKQRNALELKCFQLEQRLKECDAETRGLITMNEELRRFKESIVAVVEGRNGMNGVEISRQYGGDCPFDDIGSMKSFNPDSHSAMFGL